MNARIVRIGNSKGLRIPGELLSLYHLEEGSVVTLEKRREGILLKTDTAEKTKLPWDRAYREMALEAAETGEWAEWDSVAGDGVED